MDNINDITVLDMSKSEIKLSDYNGKVLLIVNVASECGYTKQYEGLQKIFDKYNQKGFEILAFPCNDFGGQEPGTNEQIQNFCSVNFGVMFKLFDKIKVLGEDKSPLYERLINNPDTEQGDIRWNFEKFLISKEGKIVERFRSAVTPTSDELVSAIENELGL
ncbi:MAG: glutathione peroxidase [Ignavibacteria bacterium]|nr:glutathione peroxidase [Ignavibacteria bacterium]MBT8381025.1 glutathione peroxidase [Ignavibacteria bacterium]MBT8390519.1 glutathione peroxidase [Ignavibacteria bacterium]NNJ51786.1 glutathione peroxidase [Ignavibacteriaceae bacterium]NNL22794.1 glutathione peroxidase [Ignavibacteriaceae bacterium]